MSGISGVHKSLKNELGNDLPTEFQATTKKKPGIDNRAVGGFGTIPIARAEGGLIAAPDDSDSSLRINADPAYGDSSPDASGLSLRSSAEGGFGTISDGA